MANLSQACSGQSVPDVCSSRSDISKPFQISNLRHSEFRPWLPFCREGIISPKRSFMDAALSGWVGWKNEPASREGCGVLLRE
jgi:hypothetical protein